jgi:hypothetical protein
MHTSILLLEKAQLDLQHNIHRLARYLGYRLAAAIKPRGVCLLSTASTTVTPEKEKY